MFIKRLRIENFKVYPGTNEVVFTEPNPSSNLNCYLFGGLNGAGKTSLLQAIVLGLYGIGSEGIAFDRTRGENLNSVYGTFLEESLSHRAKADGDLQMEVEVVLDDGGEEISIARTWWFKENGNLEDEGIEVWVSGKPLKVSVSDDARFEVLQEFVDSLIPTRVAKFFFFDGEQIKDISERDPSSSVVDGLDALLGFNTLSRLDEDLTKILRDIQSEVEESPSRSAYLAALAEVDELEEKQSRLEDDLVEVKRASADHQAEAARVEERLAGIFAGSSVQESSELIDQISAKEAESRSLTNEIGKFVGDLLYLALPQRLLADTVEQLEGELVGQTWEANRKQFDPQRDRVMDRMFGDSAPQPDPPLSKPQSRFLRQRLDDEWTQMFYPPPSEVPDSKLVSNWSPNQMEDALRHAREVQSRTRQELVTRIGARNRIEREVQKLRTAHKQFQVGPEAQEAIDRKAELAGLLADLEAQGRDLQRGIDAISAEIRNARATASKLSETVNQAEHVRRRYEAARALKTSVREFMDELRQRRVLELGRRMTEMMKKLAHKDDLISEIRIDPTTYVLRILNKKGEEVQAPSAGEREVFALSMLWGLARISQRNLPVVIDTPLGRLDQKRRGNIIKHYFPEAGDQVIILSTDSEIDDKWYKKLRPSVVQEFALEHDDTEEVTTIVADKYFGFS